MDIQYKKWLDITLSHTYFKDGKSTIFELIPLQDTAQILQNYKMLMHKRGHVFSLYLGLKNGENLDLSTQLEGIKELYFQMTTNDIQFFNYTDLELMTDNQRLYFSNNALGTPTGQLQKSTRVSAQDIITIKPKIFSMRLPSGEIQIEVKNTLGISVFQKSITSPSEINYGIDLSPQSDGLYEVWVNGQLEETFFACAQELPPNNLGVIHINIAALLENNQEDMQYHIDFKSREVYRKYQIIIPESRNIDVTDIQIKSPQGELYEGPLENEIVGGQTAQVFKSKTQIALQQQSEVSPELTMSYTSRVSHTASTLDMKLPNPDVGSISKEENEESFFSSTIVYV